MRLADPRPALCTLCCNTGHETTKFVDTGAFREGPLLRDSATGEIAVDPSGAQITLDDVYVCDACVRWMAKLIGEDEFAEEIRSQFLETRRLQLAVEHWRDYAKRLEATLQDRPEPAPRQRRKAA